MLQSGFVHTGKNIRDGAEAGVLPVVIPASVHGAEQTIAVAAVAATLGLERYYFKHCCTYLSFVLSRVTIILDDGIRGNHRSNYKF